MIHSEVNCQSSCYLCGFSDEIFNYFEIDIRDANLRPLRTDLLSVNWLLFYQFMSFVIRLINRYMWKRRKNIKLPPQRRRDMLWYTRNSYAIEYERMFFIHFSLSEIWEGKALIEECQKKYLFHDEWNENICKQTLIISRQCKDDV